MTPRWLLWMLGIMAVGQLVSAVCTIVALALRA